MASLDSSFILVCLGAALLTLPACDGGSSGGGGGGSSSTSGSEPDPNPDPSLPDTTTGGVPEPGTTTSATTSMVSDTEAESDTDSGSSSSGRGTTTGERTGCVDEDIGSSVGDAVASGNTEGGSDDFDLRYCDEGFGTGSTGGFATTGATTDATTIGTTDGTTDTGFGTTGDFGGDGGDYVVSWTPPADGTYTVSTSGSDIDTVLSIAAPECGSEALACNDDCEQLQSSVVYEATAGETVYIVIEGYAGRRGDFVLSISEGDTQECEFGGGTTGTTTGVDSIGTSP